MESKQGKNYGLASKSLMLTFVRCTTYVSSFAQTMILSRAFDKFNYGCFSQAKLVVSMISPLLLLGLSNAANFFYNQSDEKRDYYISTIYNLILCLGITGGAGVLVFRYPISDFFRNRALVPLIYIVAIRPLFINMQSFFAVVYIASNREKILAIRNTVNTIVQLIVVVAAAYFYRNIKLVLILLVITDFIQICIFHIHFSRNITKLRFFKIETKAIRRILVYAVPLAVSTMLGTFSVHLDALLIGRMMPTETFALYSNMAKELPFNFFISSFSEVVFPRIILLKSSNQDGKLVKLYKAYLSFGMVTTFVFVFGAVVCAKDIILILYSQKYVEGLPIFLVYLAVSALRFTYHGMLLAAQGKSKDIMIASFISLLCNTILNFALFYTIGIIGPAVATFITVLLTAAYQIGKGLRLLHCPFKSIFDVRYMCRLFSELIAIGVAFYYLKSCCPNLPVLVRTVIFYGAYVAVLILINCKHLKSCLSVMNRIQ